MMKKSENEFWMQEALKEARQSTGLTSPNPAVGAVVVKDGEIIARGRTQRAGGNHAEREALGKLALGESQGGTLYVTLEPCSTQGRSGACTDILLQSGVSRVVYGTVDPNPAHAGKANAILRAAGIQVEQGICEDECQYQIRGFTSAQTKGRPWIIAKTAMSLDGRISRPFGEGQWLSGKESREEVQLLRGEVDAIITSGETVRRDNPSLTIRSDQVSLEKIQPLRVVLTRQGLDKDSWQIFNDKFASRTRLMEGNNLELILSKLSAEEGINTALLECGGRLMGEFFDAGLIDEMMIFYTPMVTGGPHAALGGQGVSELENRWGLENPGLRRFGDDLCLRGLVKRQSGRKLER